MSIILNGMSKQDDETIIPLGVVLIAVGFIVLLTAVGIYFILPKATPELVQRAQVAAMPTAAPDQAAEPVALLPESPAAETEEGLVSLADVAQGFIPGQPERIVVPAIDLDAPVSGIGLAQVINNGQTYYQWQVPSEYRAGWHNTSAPLGQPGNTVLNGHHNIFGEVFRDLVDLEAGDEIFVFDREQVYTYTVSLVEILPERGQPLEVRIANAEWIASTPDERLTLVTCWPYEDNSHRVVVVANPAEGPGAVVSDGQLEAVPTPNQGQNN